MITCPHCGKEIFDMGVSLSEIKNDPQIPEGAKNLMFPLVQALKSLERNWSGAIETAYLRGKQDGEEDANP